MARRVTTTDTTDKAPPKTKRERFLALAVPRVNKVLKALAGVQRMAARGSYEYTEEESQAVVDACLEAVRKVKDAFSGQKDNDTGFTLPT